MSSCSQAPPQPSVLQRALLGKLAALLSDTQQPVAVRLATLETLRVLLRLLGEILPDTLPSLRDPIMLQLTCPHECLRHQVPHFVRVGSCVVLSVTANSICLHACS